MGNAILKEYDVSETQVASGGVGMRWKIFPAKNKKTRADVSVFILEKKGLPKKLRNERYYELIRTEVSLLAKLRHPHVLNVLHPIDENRNSFVMVTEPVHLSLANFIGDHENVPKASVNHLPDVSELDLKNGLRQIGEALLFCHRDAKMYHLNIHECGIYVTKRGDWKLAGFNFGRPTSGSGETISFPVDFSTRSEIGFLPSLSSVAPEIANKQEASNLSDAFSLGMVALRAHQFYTKKPRDSTPDDLSAYNRYVNSLSSLDSRIKDFPKSLKGPLERLLCFESSRRIDVLAFLKGEFFSDVLVRTLRYLDSLLEKDLPNRIKFLKQLPKALHMFDKRTAATKILPPLLVQMQDKSVALFALPAVLAIAKDVERTYFAESIMPSLIPLLNTKDPPQIVFCLLQNLTLLMDRSTPDLQRDHILPLLVRALESPHAPLRSQALKEITSVALKKENSFSFRDLKTVLLPRVKTLCCIEPGAKTLTIRVNAMICLSRIFKLFDMDTISSEVLDAIDMAIQKERAPAVLMSALGVYDQVSKHVGTQLTAKRILPKLIPLTLDTQLNLKQTQMFFRVIRQCTEQLEKVRVAELKKAEYMLAQSKEAEKAMLEGADPLDDLNPSNQKALQSFMEDEYASTETDNAVVSEVGAEEAKNGMGMGAGDAFFDDMFGSSASSTTSSPAPSTKTNGKPKQNSNASSVKDPFAGFSMDTPPPSDMGSSYSPPSANLATNTSTSTTTSRTTGSLLDSGSSSKASAGGNDSDPFASLAASSGNRQPPKLAAPRSNSRKAKPLAKKSHKSAASASASSSGGGDLLFPTTSSNSSKPKPTKKNAKSNARSSSSASDPMDLFAGLSGGGSSSTPTAAKPKPTLGGSSNSSSANAYGIGGGSGGAAPMNSMNGMPLLGVGAGGSQQPIASPYGMQRNVGMNQMPPMGGMNQMPPMGGGGMGMGGPVGGMGAYGMPPPQQNQGGAPYGFFPQQQQPPGGMMPGGQFMPNPMMGGGLPQQNSGFPQSGMRAPQQQQQQRPKPKQSGGNDLFDFGAFS